MIGPKEPSDKCRTELLDKKQNAEYANYNINDQVLADIVQMQGLALILRWQKSPKWAG